MELTAAQRQRYSEDGFVLVPSIFGGQECDDFVAHMAACRAAQLAGAPPRPRAAGETSPESLGGRVIQTVAASSVFH
jgi:hypothetical protein